MKILANLLTSLVVAGWIVVSAILSVQNATLVSLKFLNFESIQLPVGLVLAFSTGVGIVAVALTQPLWLAGTRRGISKSQNNLEDDEFFGDESQ